MFGSKPKIDLRGDIHMPIAGIVSVSHAGVHMAFYVGPCIAIARCTRATASTLSIVLENLSTPRRGAVFTTGIQGTAPPVIS
jgi:hypothetical protein